MITRAKRVTFLGALGNLDAEHRPRRCGMPAVLVQSSPDSLTPARIFRRAARQSEATNANVGATNTALRSRRTQNHNSRRDSNRSRDKLAPRK